jgi:hypothetical protein
MNDQRETNQRIWAVIKSMTDTKGDTLLGYYGPADLNGYLTREHKLAFVRGEIAAFLNDKYPDDSERFAAAKRMLEEI